MAAPSDLPQVTQWTGWDPSQVGLTGRALSAVLEAVSRQRGEERAGTRAGLAPPACCARASERDRPRSGTFCHVSPDELLGHSEPRFPHLALPMELGCF